MDHSGSEMLERAARAGNAYETLQHSELGSSRLETGFTFLELYIFKGDQHAGRGIAGEFQANREVFP
jgi:hypothetical protein